MDSDPEKWCSVNGAIDKRVNGIGNGSRAPIVTVEVGESRRINTLVRGLGAQYHLSSATGAQEFCEES